MRRSSRTSIGLLILLLALFLGCLGHRRSEERALLERLKQLEKEEGWRILVHEQGIQYLDIGTASLTRVYMPPPDTMDAGYVGEASFDPEGTKITFGENWGKERALIVFDLIERKNEALLTMPYLHGARWSPNGKEIAFQGRSGHSGNYSLYLYRLSDRQSSLIVEKELRGPGVLSCWRPDGKSIVYEDSEANIWIIDVETRKRKKLDKGWFPTCSPNGRYVAYPAEGAGNPGDVVYDLQTGRKESIVVGKWSLGGFIWSPDSRYLVYSRASRGFWDYVVAFFGDMHYGDLYVMDVESKVEVRVYTHGRTIYPTDWAKTTALK